MSKKIFMILFLLLVLISASAVCAADLDDNNNTIASSGDMEAFSIANDIDTIDTLNKNDANSDDNALQNDTQPVSASNDKNILENKENDLLSADDNVKDEILGKQDIDPKGIIINVPKNIYPNSGFTVTVEAASFLKIIPTGKCEIMIDSDSYPESFQNGKATFKIKGVKQTTTAKFSWDGDGYYNPYSTSFDINVVGPVGPKKNVNPTITQNPDPAQPNDKITIKVINFGEYGIAPTGTAYLTVNGKKETIKLMNNYFDIPIIAPEKTTKATLTWDGDTNYNPYEKTFDIRVEKIPTEIIVQNTTIEMKIGDEVEPVVSIMPSGAGELDFISSDVSVVTVNGIGTITAVGEGVANVTVRFMGNEKYAAAESKNITVTVSLNDASVSVNNSTLDLFVGDNFTVVATTVPAGLNVTFVQDDSGVYSVDDNGVVTALKEGTGSVLVKVTGNDGYAENSTTVDVVIVKKKLNLNATTFAIIGNMSLIVSGFENATGNVSITVGEYNYNPSIMMGVVFVSLPKFNETVTAYIYYPGDDKYYNASTTVDIIPKKDLNLTIVADPIYVGENATVIVNGLENATGNVMVIAGMNFNNVTIINGTATATISGLNKTTTVTVFYMGDNNYNMNYTSVNITVLPKENLTISASAKAISVGEKATVVVTGLKNAIGEVTVRANNKEYSAPIVDGTAKVVIPGLTKSATAYVDYEGDRRYNPSNTTAKITVNKIKTKLTAKAVTTTYAVNKKLVITLKDSKGNPIKGVKISVKLGKSKTPTTNNKGQVEVSTKDLAPKKYTAKITFNGNSKYDKSTKSVKVTVKKATPKITAKSMTFKTTTKTKKYTIVLKNNVNKAIGKAGVYLKVGGKTYKATTNSKGKATFKITKLTNKGTFKATITFKGNAYYNKATKKASIKVKPVWKTVSKGSKDKATVKKIQKALKKNGYYLQYPVDGIYQQLTFQAVKQFQKAKSLKVTGKVDEKTAVKLGII